LGALTESAIIGVAAFSRVEKPSSGSGLKRRIPRIEERLPMERKVVLCDIHYTPMDIIQYKWSVFPKEENVSTFLRCPICTRHYSPLQGYVNITPQGMDTDNRRMNVCPNTRSDPHGSMAIVADKEDAYVWACLHPECRQKEG
jgi:hypothetical protein